MLCPECGKDVGDNYQLCTACQAKKKLREDAQNPQKKPEPGIKGRVSDAQAPQAKSDSTEILGNSGFWLRVLASFLDQSIIALTFGLIALIFSSISPAVLNFLSGFGPSSALVIATIGAMFITLLVSFLGSMLYYPLFESSRLQATPGKILLGLKVSDAEDRKLSFLRALLRNIGKILSGLLFGIGFLMVAFSKEKQGLHDRIAGTYVVYTNKTTAARVIIGIVCVLLLQVPIKLLDYDEDSPTFGGQKVFSKSTSLPPTLQLPSNNEEKTVHFSISEQNQERSVAVWNYRSRELEVGFYAQPLNEAQRIQAADLPSLESLSNNPLLVSVVFEVRPDIDHFVKESILSYRILIHPGFFATQGIAEAQVTERLNYFPREDDGSRLTEIRGTLDNNQLVSGKLSNRAYLEKFGATIVWDIAFATKLLQENAHSFKPSASNRDKSIPSLAAGPRAEFFASEAKFKSIAEVGFFSARDNVLTIGFYSEPPPANKLTEPRLLWTFVEGKRPNAILIVSFRPGASVLNTKEIQSYEVYFFRDTVGSFYFPGQFDRQSVKRLPMELQTGELSRLEVEGRIAKISMKFSHPNPNLGTIFSWDIDKEIAVRVLQ